MAAIPSEGCERIAAAETSKIIYLRPHPIRPLTTICQEPTTEMDWSTTAASIMRILAFLL